MLIHSAIRNRYWLLLTIALLAIAIYLYPHSHAQGVPLDQLFTAELQDLQTPVHVDFDNVPLRQVFDTFAHEAHCPITPSWLRLSNSNVNFEIPVFAHAPGTLPLEQAIALIFRSIDVLPANVDPDDIRSWRDAGIITVGTNTDIYNQPVTVIYDVSDIVYRAEFLDQDAKMDTLVRLLSPVGLGDPAILFGGFTGARGFATCFNDKLIVRTSRYNHRRLANLLLKLRGP